ncbi:MAG TPA: hypothetical protein VEC01_02385 [Noviherbaspirillum sp.]|uniref:hypothetical protein n=1 Tax=Noviherbaspirillum sp. TaxID=1926288 RepID=UPI002D6282E4|nr:hypothetical protein [Noviherbaspirillum sp.]HYD94147.1 hypothetical protein [Noviherbaspirillum sp.]
MSEQVEWEVVDAPRATGKQHSARDTMRMLLGKWWQWKVAGTAAVTLLTLALFATLTGAAVLLFAVGSLLSVAIRKLKSWLGDGRRDGGLMKSCDPLGPRR